ncbi:YbaN family protein [Aquamicrobium sp. LC103]|uniref:YbaN family protein n=1 Tax=Aquamicrobium sp. LC103 TaxID=1120658 RepID=UPI0009E3D5E0|nr:YbaN family protein [Aquamicrobium sp. LC103]TKT76371.1 DUF454 domain-containing protein [Aquamicrobium sp. LC103]
MVRPQIFPVSAPRASIRDCGAETGISKPFDFSVSLDEARQAGYIALGCLMLLLGIIGALLPVMPTTIFLILAAWCFGRSSPRLEAWMLDHPRFGRVLRDWSATGAMPFAAKLMACGGMAAGYALFWLTVEPAAWLATLVAGLVLGCAGYVAARPNRVRAARCEGASVA